MLYILDYGAGNVRSLANSIRKLGHDFEWVKQPSDLAKADVSTVHVPPRLIGLRLTWSAETALSRRGSLWTGDGIAAEARLC